MAAISDPTGIDAGGGHPVGAHDLDESVARKSLEFVRGMPCQRREAPRVTLRPPTHPISAHVPAPLP